MTDNIVLGATSQQNLLALQNINSELSTTQNALATGLAVSSAVDDAVKYFQSQSLQDRATDLVDAQGRDRPGRLHGHHGGAGHL